MYEKKQHRFLVNVVGDSKRNKIFVCVVCPFYLLTSFVKLILHEKKGGKNTCRWSCTFLSPPFPPVWVWVCHSTGESEIRNCPDIVWPGTDFTGAPKVCFKQSRCDMLVSRLVESFHSLTDYCGVPWGQSKQFFCQIIVSCQNVVF